MKNRIIIVLIMLAMGAGILSGSSDAVAAENGEAERALVDALEIGTIPFNEGMNYAIADFDGDGMNDLFLSADPGAYIYSYKSGEVKQILKPFYVEYVLAYDKKKNVFWMWGEGDGGWVFAYKFKNNKLDFMYKYVNGLYGKHMNKWGFSFQKKGKKAKKISKKKYMSAVRHARKWYKKKSKSALIDELKEIGGLTRDEPTTDPSMSETEDETVYSTYASIVKDYGINGSVFHMSLNKYEWGAPVFSIITKTNMEWGEYTETNLRELEFEMEDDFICTVSDVCAENKAYEKTISYDTFKSCVDTNRKIDGVDVGIDIFVRNGKIYRLGLVYS